MIDPEPPARRLTAGAVGPERRPYRKDPDEPRWFEPIHVRAPGVARDAMAAAVAAGADVLVAPTWLTHRRALLPVGETRRAAAWTAAAVRVAREAVDRGLELRERAEDAAVDPGQTASRGPAGQNVPRLPVLVAGVLPFLGEIGEADSGRLAPRDVGLERDLRAAAGLLAEAEVDLLLVDGGPTVEGARAAADAAVETGRPVWITAPIRGSGVPALAGGEAVEAWATSMIHAGVVGFLVAPAPGTDAAAALERLRAAGVATEQTGVLPMLLGAWAADETGPASGGAAAISAASGAPPERGAEVALDARDPDAGRPQLSTVATRWLEAGAWHLGIGDGATPDRLAALRAAMDAVDGARLAARAAARDRWVALVGEAARRAPGGRAAWIGPHDPDVPLPGGFAWTVVPASVAAALPAAEVRLVIAAAPLPGERLAALLEPGGVLLARDADPRSVSVAGLRLLEIVEEPPAILARRDP